jgi:hypothetical protein
MQRLKSRLAAIEQAERARINEKIDRLLESFTDAELEECAGMSATGFEHLSDEEMNWQIEESQRRRQREPLRTMVDELAELRDWLARKRSAEASATK